MIWRVNRTTAFRCPISHAVEFSLSNSQIFLIARRAASDKPYRRHTPSISLSSNAFRFSSLLILSNFEFFNFAFEVSSRFAQVRKRIERLSPSAANVFAHVAKIEVQVEGFDHIKHFDPVAFVVIAFFFHRFLSIVEGGRVAHAERRSFVVCAIPNSKFAVGGIVGRKQSAQHEPRAPVVSYSPFRSASIVRTNSRHALSCVCPV